MASGALDDKGPAARIRQPNRECGLVFRRIVPAARGLDIGELGDDDAPRLGAALDQFGLAAAHEKAAAILGDAGAGQRAVRLIALWIGNLDLGDEISWHLCPPACSAETRPVR